MLALREEDLEMVSGGKISDSRKFAIIMEVAWAKLFGLSLEEAQDRIANNQEERDFIAYIW